MILLVIIVNTFLLVNCQSVNKGKINNFQDKNSIYNGLSNRM